MKKQNALLIALLVFAVVLAGCSSPGVNTTIPEEATAKSTVATTQDSLPIIDADSDGIKDSIENQLIESFVPIVKFHPQEQYLPANVPWYLSRARMRYNVNRGFDDKIIEKGTLNLTNLITQTCQGQPSGLCETTTEFFLEATDKNGGDALDDYRKETRKGTDSSNWVCYAHVRPSPSTPEMCDIQYIFLYAYNGSIISEPVQSAHEADFEHITVRVEKDLKTVYGIYYAAHDGEGKWYKIASAGQGGYTLNGGRPVVYSAVDSHASYPNAGKWLRKLMPDDVTEDGGPVWDCQKNVINLGEKSHPCLNMQWIQYSGRWGEIGEASWTCGPYGPAYQNWWNADPE
ncbi:MAG: Vps62-related protein [Chloroflexota bacterium]